MSQLEFARLMGVHVMTVSRWERGTLKPPVFQAELLNQAQVAAKQPEGTGLIGHALRTEGLIAALRLLLQEST